MSSETDMENNRIQILKEILLDLHHGASPESVQERFNQHFKGVSALEISLKGQLQMWKWQTLIKKATLSMFLNRKI